MNEDYTTAEWFELRNSILKRDNYTCRNCQIFNPKYGDVKIEGKFGNIEVHKFGIFDTGGTPGFNTKHYNYQIDSQFHNKSFCINFCNTIPKFPVLQVHHKSYKANCKCWEYNKSDLETLCKSCHIEYHRQNPIPVYDMYGNKTLIQFEPLDDVNNDPLHFENGYIINSNQIPPDCTLKVSVYSFSQERKEVDTKNEGQVMLDLIFSIFSPGYKRNLYGNINPGTSFYTRYFKIASICDMDFKAKQIHLKRFEKCKFTEKLLPAFVNTNYSFNVFENRILKNNEIAENTMVKNIEETRNDTITLEMASFDVEYFLSQ